MSKFELEYYDKRTRVYYLLMSGFSEVARFSFLLIISNLIILVGKIAYSSNDIISISSAFRGADSAFELVSMIIMLYSIIMFYDAASYFKDYDAHAYGIALTIAKVLIVSLGLGIVSWIGIVVAPIMGIASLLSFASQALWIIGGLGLSYFIYLLGEVHNRGYPVPSNRLFTLAAIAWIIGFFISVLSLISVTVLFYVSRKAAISLSSKIHT